MTKKKALPIKLIAVISAIVVGGFLLVDSYACTLKVGADMATLNQDDFLYGDFTPLFCTVLDYNDSEAMGVPIDPNDPNSYQFDGTQDVDIGDGFTIPFDKPVSVLIIEDPDGQQGIGDEGDTEIPQEDLDMIQNMTEGTDPIVNATEVDPPEMLPPEPMPVIEFVFLTEVTKISTDGTNQTETSEVQFIPFSLFVEDTTNKDFSDGRFITKLSIRSDPNVFVDGTGKFDIFLDNMTVNTQPLDITFSGITDQDGLLAVSFISPTGFLSPDHLLNIDPVLINNINPIGLTPLEYKIMNVVATVNTFDYEIIEGTIFSFNFFRSQQQILVLDAQGNEVRGYPTDDLLRFGALDGSASLKRCYKHSRTSCWMTTSYSTPLGSATIASVEVRNSAGDLLFQNLSPFTSTWIINNEPITRNDTYTVKYGRVTSANAGSISAGEFTFTTPETQMNYQFRCTVAQATAVIGSGFCRACSYLTGSPFVTCNFPSG